jgi:hypothetical protein
MSKFENDLDLVKAKQNAVRAKATLEKRFASDPKIQQILDKITPNKQVMCYIFSKSIAFRMGRGSIKSIAGFPAGLKNSFTGINTAKSAFIPLKIPAETKSYSKSDTVLLLALHYLINFSDRVKSETDKTEAVESEQVMTVQADLKKLIREYGIVRLQVGKETFDVDNFKQVPGRPKADMVFEYKGRPNIFVSHKKGTKPAAFQQYGGFAVDLQVKDLQSARAYPEIEQFLKDINETMKAMGVKKDSAGRYDLNDLQRGSNMARLIHDEDVANTVKFGKDFKTKKMGLDNCSILIDGDIVFKPMTGNIFELCGSFHTDINPELQKKKKRFISDKNDVYSPAMFILKSEQQGLNQAGLANARAVIWPNNQIIQGYTAQFERMFRGVKTKNSNTIEGLKKEFKK